MPKAWKSVHSHLAVITLIVLSGLVTSGCSTPITAKELSTSKPTVISTENQQQSNPKNSSSTAHKADEFNLQEGMPYAEARSHLLQQGWSPNTQSEAADLNDTTVRELFDLGYEEVKSCAGTGLGPCRFEFINDAGKLFVVITIQNGGSSRDRVVHTWFTEEQSISHQQSSSVSTNGGAPPFFGIRYFNFYGGNGTGQSITVEMDGSTTVEAHGTMNSSILFRGQFSNPLTLSDGTILRIEENRIYQVSASGEVVQGCNGEGKPCESALDEPTASTPPILDGLYMLGGTDQGLEVSRERYRYTDEMGVQEWRPLSELTYIQDNVVFDGNVYWCIPPESEPGVCTENGWQSVQ